MGLVIAANKGVLAPYGVFPYAVAGAVLFVTGAWAAAVFARRGHRRALLAASLGWGGLYLAAVLALPRVVHDLTTQDLALAAANVPGARVVAYRGYPQSLALTLGHAIPVVDYVGELASDGARPPEIFWSSEEFWRRWKAGEPMAVVIPPPRARRLGGAGTARSDDGGLEQGISCSDERCRRSPRPQDMSADKTLIRDTFLPFSRPLLGEEEIAELVESLRSGWITTGPKVEKFSAMFAEYVGGKHAVALSSATAGLHLRCWRTAWDRATK